MHRKLIPVRYPDGQIDKIPKQLLHTMIESDKIIEFKRKDGWVVLGKDTIRGMGQGHFAGEEKRWH